VGVKKWNFVPWEWASIDELSPRTIAIDAPNYLMRRLSTVRRNGKFNRVPLGHIHVALGTIRAALRIHILPVLVFDGPPETLKRTPNPELIIAAHDLYRTFSSERDPYNHKLVYDLHGSPALRMYFAAFHVKDLCKSLGIPCINSPSEAEMAAAVMCRDGLVGTVVSNDADALLFGSPHVTKQLHLTKREIFRVTRSKLEAKMDLDLEHLRDLAIVCGCDFHKQGVKGVGPRKGVVLLQRHGGLVGLLNARVYTAFQREEYILAREVFDEPNHMSSSGFDITLRPPMIPTAVRLLSAVMGTEKAEDTVAKIIRLWKDFGEQQTTLEQFA
jgi:flap endonuclease-1